MVTVLLASTLFMSIPKANASLLGDLKQILEGIINDIESVM